VSPTTRSMSLMGFFDNNRIEGCRTVRLSTFDQFSVLAVPYHAC
jgi:hypothetical protein